MITKIKAKPYSLMGLYDAIAEAIGKDPETCRYDCRKVNIASNLQQCIYDYYIAQNPEYPQSQVECEVSMLLVTAGPKADKTLQNDAVEIFDGFITEIEQ